MSQGSSDNFVDRMIGRIETKEAANDNGSPVPVYRVIIEDEDTGREFIGWGGISRARVERIVEFVDNKGVADEKIGRLPARKLNLDGLARNRNRNRGRR